MAKKLYIGNLAYSTTDEGLKAACSQFGTVESAVVINDKMTGRSKGFGFVEMSTEEEAQKVVESLNGQEVDGRAIRVSEARPMEERPRGSFGGGNRERRW
jgi:RNA recognition motif-containing protein